MVSSSIFHRIRACHTALNLGGTSGDFGANLGQDFAAVDFLSNHYHLILTDPYGNLPEFMRYLNEFSAKCINALYGRWESVYAPGSYSAVRLVSSQDALDKTIYTLINPVKAALVKYAHHWPGVITCPLNLERELVAKRPSWFFDAEGDMPEKATLRLTMPPCFEHMDSHDYVDMVNHEVERSEKACHEKIAKEARTFLGRRNVLKQSPFDYPEGFEPRRGLSPRIACKDKWKRIEALQYLKEFWHKYRDALLKYRSGDRKAVFPYGTYWMRVYMNVAVATPGCCVEMTLIPTRQIASSN